MPRAKAAKTTSIKWTPELEATATQLELLSEEHALTRDEILDAFKIKKTAGQKSAETRQRNEDTRMEKLREAGRKSWATRRAKAKQAA